MLHTALYACMWLLSHLRGFTSKLPRTMRQTRNQLRNDTYLYFTCETLPPSIYDIHMCHFTWKGGKTYRVCFVSPNSPGRKGSRWGQRPGELDPFAPSRLKLLCHTQFTFPREPGEAASQSSTVASGRSCLRPSLVQFDTPRNAPLQSPSRHRRTCLRPLTTDHCSSTPPATPPPRPALMNCSPSSQQCGSSKEAAV